jgi:hypothetical protein
MRIEIKTNKPIRDPDIRAIYLINQAMKISSPRMRQANLDLVLNRDWHEFDAKIKEQQKCNQTKK